MKPISISNIQIRIANLKKSIFRSWSMVDRSILSAVYRVSNKLIAYKKP